MQNVKEGLSSSQKMEDSKFGLAGFESVAESVGIIYGFPFTDFKR